MVNIYQITNENTHKIYVGQTTLNIEERLKQHFKVAKEVENKSRIDYNGMYTDILDLGEHIFSIKKLDYCAYRHRFIIEEYWINRLGTEGFNLYNKNPGSKQNDEQKQKIAEIHRENIASYQTQEFKQKISSVTSGTRNGMYGKTMADAPNGQEVFMKNKNGDVLKIFPSVKCALSHLGVVGHAGLIKACKTGEAYKGHYWTKTWSNR